MKENLVLAAPLFRGLNINTLLAIIMQLKSQLVLPGEVVVRQGTVGDRLFLVYRGKLKVFQDTFKDGNTHSLRGERKQIQTQAIHQVLYTYTRPKPLP
jgi:CRP-like cAMP-binding protein